MISLTMSRISSRARFGVELGELRQVDRLDQRGEDRALDLVIGFRAARIARGRHERLRPAAGRERRRCDRRAEPVGRQRRAADVAAAGARRHGGRAGSGAGGRRRSAGLRRSRARCGTLSEHACLRGLTHCLRLSFSMQRGQQARRADRLHLGAAGQRLRELSGRSPPSRWPDDTSAIIWPLLAAVPNSCGSNGIDGDRLELERLGEVGRLDLRPLRHADLVEAVLRAAVVRARRAQQVDQVLGVAQVGEIGRRDDQDVVGADQRALGPAGPDMRHVEHDAAARSRAATSMIGRRPRRRNRRPGRASRARRAGSDVGALRQQPVEKAVSMRSGENTASAMPCGGSWLKSRPAVPKAGRGRRRRHRAAQSRAIAQAMLWAIVEAPTPPLAPTNAIDAADRLGVGRMRTGRRSRG